MVNVYIFVRYFFYTFLVFSMLGCNKQDIELTGFNFSLSKDEILVNKGESEALIFEHSIYELEVSSTSDFNQDIELEIDLGLLNSYLSQPFETGRAKIKLSATQHKTKLPIPIAAIPSALASSEFKVSIKSSSTSINLSSSELIFKIDSRHPEVTLGAINGRPTVDGDFSPNNNFSMNGTCSGQGVTIYVQKFNLTTLSYDDVPVRDSANAVVTCSNSLWSAVTLDTSNLPEGLNSLRLIAKDAHDRYSSATDFSVSIDRTAPRMDTFSLNALFLSPTFTITQNDILPAVLTIESAGGPITTTNFSSQSLDNGTTNSELSFTYYLAPTDDVKTNTIVTKSLVPGTLFTSRPSAPNDFTAPLMDGTYYVGLEITDKAGNSSLKTRQVIVDTSVVGIEYISVNRVTNSYLKVGDTIQISVHLTKTLKSGLTLDTSLTKIKLNAASNPTASYVSYEPSTNGHGVINFSYTVQSGHDTNSLKFLEVQVGNAIFQSMNGSVLATTTYASPPLTPKDAFGAPIIVVFDTIAPTAPALALSSPATSPSNQTSLTIALGNLTLGEYVGVYSEPTCNSMAIAMISSASAINQTLTISGLTAQATHQFYAKKKDAAMNSSSCTGPLEYTIDTIAPTVTPNLFTNLNFHQKVPLISWMSADTDIAYFELSIGVLNTDGFVLATAKAWTNIGKPSPVGNTFSISDFQGFNLTNSQDYVVGIRAYDTAGNHGETNIAFTMNASEHAYIKSFNNDANDLFANYSVDIQNDTMVTGAVGESSDFSGTCNRSSFTSVSAMIISCKATNNSVSQSGAVYVYRKTSNDWEIESYIKSPAVRSGDQFGYSVSLDGDRIAIGVPYDDMQATGVMDLTSLGTIFGKSNSGIVYIYQRTGNNWNFEAALKASDNNTDKRFGSSVKLKGKYLVVGSPGSSSVVGSAYLFELNGSSWGEKQILHHSAIQTSDLYGDSVSMTLSPREIIVIGAPQESSGSTTIEAYPFSTGTSAAYSGAAYVFEKNSSIFSVAYRIKASNASSNDKFGYVVSISEDTLVITAPLEDSSTNTITNGSTSSPDDSMTSAGAAYVYRLNNGDSSWYQEAYLKPKENSPLSTFGLSASFSANTVVIGAPGNINPASPIGNGLSYLAPTCSNSCTNTGAAYIFSRLGSVWSQENYLKASNAAKDFSFGSSIAIDSLKNIAVGSGKEKSNTTVIVNGSITPRPSDQTLTNSGAVYLFKK